ncbi:15864_t:CDS:2 [Funneliformis caledonium]|uniref:15864_t:CDS:1 n=1 Tax=Funneliformis caledonium TaxID=1117310 RepID=A0A9N8YVL3_9GLOM|nr:15864_t:CDS:2 [Funneliformis caledonium]
MSDPCTVRPHSESTDVSKAKNSFWNTSSPASSSSNNGIKRNVPLKANGSLDILEVIKSAVHIFDKDTIEIGSSRSYKSSKHLRIDYEQYSTFLPINGNLFIINKIKIYYEGDLDAQSILEAFYEHLLISDDNSLIKDHDGSLLKV